MQRMTLSEPLLGLFVVHRAIERVLGDLVRMAVHGGCNEILRMEAETLQRILVEHCHLEVSVILPTLEARIDTKQPLRRNLEYLSSHGDLRMILQLFACITDLTTMGIVGNDVNNKLSWKIRELDVFLRRHLSEEEQTMPSLFTEYLKREEQGRLLVETVSPYIMNWVTGILGVEETEQFLRVWTHFAAEKDGMDLKIEFKEGMDVWTFGGSQKSYRHCHSVDDAMRGVTNNEISEPQERLEFVSGLKHRPDCAFPVKLSTEKHISPLIELQLVRSALRRELKEAMFDVRDLDLTDGVQLQSVQRNIRFLQKAHTFFSKSESTVLLEALAVNGIDTASLRNSHSYASSCTEELATRVLDLMDIARGDMLDRNLSKDRLVSSFETLIGHIVGHMDERDTQLLPLVFSTFSLEEQGLFVRRVMAKFPTVLFKDLIPWVFAALSEEEQRIFICSIRATSSEEEFALVASALGNSAHNGNFEFATWQSLSQWFPDLKMPPNSAQGESLRIKMEQKPPDTCNSLEFTGGGSEGREMNGKSGLLSESVFYIENGPVKEVLRIHKAIRAELRKIVSVAKELPSDKSTNPKKLEGLTARVTFLQRIVQEHSRTEDIVLLPVLEKRIPGLTQCYQDDHHKEKERFARLTNKLERLQYEKNRYECCRLARSVRMSSRTLRDEMSKHLEKEETQLWPLLVSRFSREEQDQVVGRIFGLMPSSVLREMLPWMMRVLSIEERHKMLRNVLSITKSTLFDKWLMSWLPMSWETHASEIQVSRTDLERAPREPEGDPERPKSKSVARLRHSDGMGPAVTEVANDSSLPIEARSRLIQEMMLTRWKDYRLMRGSSSQRNLDMFEPEWVTTPEGLRVFGCAHYRRSCKMLAKCCGKLYMCRLCHDEHESHVMDRMSTEEMFCLFCMRLGPIGQYCSFPDCRKVMARYFCEICKLLDDDDVKRKYHCHSCNVCRAGQGLGIDYFHCMKCNACMDIKYENQHQCVEKTSEGKCPVCRNDLFTSTTPMKHLECGHLMHMSCYAMYARTNIRCPICTQRSQKLSDAVNKIYLNYQ